MPYPYAGQPVHYVTDAVDPDSGSRCRAALVISVWLPDPSLTPPAGTIVNLVVFDQAGKTTRLGVWYDANAEPATGTWHEPEPPDYSG